MNCLLKSAALLAVKAGKKGVIERQDEEKTRALRDNLLIWEARTKASYEQRPPGGQTTTASE